MSVSVRDFDRWDDTLAFMWARGVNSSGTITIVCWLKVRGNVDVYEFT